MFWNREPSRSIFLWTLIGRTLQRLPEFPTKGRWESMWFRRRNKDLVETRRLPGGACVECSLSDGYESWIWMRLLDRADLRALRSLIRVGGTFVDVGAHIGVWSLEAGSAVGKNGCVIAFEPNPDTYAKLVHNLSLNASLTRWQPFQAAVSSEPGRANFYLSEIAVCSRIVECSNDRTIRIPVVTVDEILKGGSCDGIKIDVEGHESAVIKGCTATLARFHPWICVELNNDFTKISRLGEWQVHQALTQLGYKCWLFEQAEVATPNLCLSGNYSTTGYVNLFYRWDP